MDECIEVLANFSDVGWSHFGFYSSIRSACRIAERQLIGIQGMNKRDILIYKHKLACTTTILDPAIWG